MAIEDAIREAREKKDKVAGFVEKIKGIGELFGEDAIDQTSKYNETVLAGLVGEEAYRQFLEDWYGVTDEVSEIICNRKAAQAPSIKGGGREDLVRILSSADLEDKEEKNKLLRIP